MLENDIILGKIKMYTYKNGITGISRYYKNYLGDIYGDWIIEYGPIYYSHIIIRYGCIWNKT